MKATTDDLLNVIRRLGQGELEEYRILRHLGISHGQFCQLRKMLVAEQRLIVTHAAGHITVFLHNHCRTKRHKHKSIKT